MTYPTTTIQSIAGDNPLLSQYNKDVITVTYPRNGIIPIYPNQSSLNEIVLFPRTNSTFSIKLEVDPNIVDPPPPATVKTSTGVQIVILTGHDELHADPQTNQHGQSEFFQKGPDADQPLNGILTEQSIPKGEYTVMVTSKQFVPGTLPIDIYDPDWHNDRLYINITIPTNPIFFPTVNGELFPIRTNMTNFDTSNTGYVLYPDCSLNKAIDAAPE